MDYARALKLYEKSLALRQDDKLDARQVLSQMEIARLYFIEEQYEKAAVAFDVVRDALDNPDKYELSDKVHTTLLGNPRVTYTLFGESFLKAGRLEVASQMFEKAFPDQASAPLLAYHLGRIELKNGRPKSALDQLEKYLVAKQSGAGRGPYALLEEVLDELHDDEDAARRLQSRLEELLRDDPANHALAYFLAEKYQEQAKLKKAGELLASTVKSEPTIDGFAKLLDIHRQQADSEKTVNNTRRRRRAGRLAAPL